MTTSARPWGSPHVHFDPALVERLAALEQRLVGDASLPLGMRIDVHAHLGTDADGHTMHPADLVADMDMHGVSQAVVFAANQPGDDGSFRQANRAVIEAHHEWPDRYVPFCRVDPAVAAPAAMTQAYNDGAVGLKIHPVSQRIAIDDPRVVECVARASGWGWPVLFHAGFGARALAAPLQSLLEQVPHCRIILAHGARGDAQQVAQGLRDDPRVWWDTSLGVSPDLALLDPRRVLYGADRPYGDHATGFHLVRCAAAIAGWSDQDVAAIMGGNAQRLLAGGA